MSKYTNIRQVRPQDKPRPWKVHPIWQGFGCIMLILIPVMSYAGAILLIESDILAQIGVPLSPDFMMTRPVNPFPETIPIEIAPQPHLYGNLAVGAVLMLLGFGVLMVIYAVLYRMIGPSPLGPMDAKPIRQIPKGSSGRRR